MRADETGSTGWTYDSHGRVTAKTQTIGAIARKTAYGYDASGRLARITYPSGKAVAVSYDSAGQIAQLALGATPILKNIQYSPFGPASAWIWGNGQTYQRAFDQDGRLTRYPLGARSRDLAYDQASRIVDYADSDPANSQHFDYDAIDRLTSAAINPKAAFGAGQTLETFGYDSNGNRVLETVKTATTLQYAYAYDTGGNRLAKVTPTGQAAFNYSYDAAGNTLSDGVNAFAYNDRGRLSQVNHGGVTTQYAINGLGQRVKKTTPSAATLFVYDEAGHLLGEYAANGAAIREIVYLGDLPVAVLAGSAVSYVHADHLNAPRALVDAAGKTVWRWDAEPFGVDAADEDPDKNGVKVTFNLRFPGQYYDAETGRHYNYYRDYDPKLGRYLQSDPIGLEGGANIYTYVNNDPLNYLDSTGLVEDKIDGSRVQIHKNDADKWPSDPHGHIYDKNQVVDISPFKML